jgi:hypothetical protein
MKGGTPPVGAFMMVSGNSRVPPLQKDVLSLGGACFNGPQDFQVHLVCFKLGIEKLFLFLLAKVLGLLGSLPLRKVFEAHATLFG